MINIVSIKDIKVTIGNTCKAYRKAHDLTREELAEVLDISRATIQNIENGKNATLDNVLKIANHFGLLAPILKSINQATNDQNNISLY